MDPFEEFDFKLLTEGLGFHRKDSSHKSEKEEKEEFDALDEKYVDKNSIKNETKLRMTNKTALFDDLPKMEMPSAKNLLSEIKEKRNVDLNESKNNFSKPHRSKMKLQDPPLPMTSSIFDRVSAPSVQGSTLTLPTIEIPKTHTIARKGSHSSPRRELKPIPFHLMAACLDTVVIGSINLLFVVALLFVTNMTLGTVMTNLKSDSMTQWCMIILLFTVIEMYLVVSRSFFGSSLGEWAFDVQLGDDLQQKKIVYPLKVLLRSIVNACTGFIVLPFLSIIFQKDLAGKICRLQLFRY